MSLNLREIHKGYLATILSSIVFDGKILPVFSGHKVSSDLPYIFITSSKIGYQTDSNDMLIDNHYYYRKLTYNIHLVTSLDENEVLTAIKEASLDELEQLILDKFENFDVRNCMIACSVNPWSDLQCREASEPFGGYEIKLNQGTAVKTFTVDVYHLVAAT